MPLAEMLSTSTLSANQSAEAAAMGLEGAIVADPPALIVGSGLDLVGPEASGRTRSVAGSAARRDHCPDSHGPAHDASQRGPNLSWLAGDSRLSIWPMGTGRSTSRFAPPSDIANVPQQPVTRALCRQLHLPLQIGGVAKTRRRRSSSTATDCFVAAAGLADQSAHTG